MNLVPPSPNPQRSSFAPRRWILAGGLILAVAVAVVYGIDRLLPAVKNAAVAASNETDPKDARDKPNPEPEKEKDPEDRERILAPELDGAEAWLNTSGPIRMRDLRGKVVVLDFWTLCCINCIHTLPELAKLEKKYANQLVVIGIHSAKFENEKNSESIRQAILRYEIHHPVANDANMKIWRSYFVRSWPTLYLIDPEGYVVGRGSGEGLSDALDEAIAKLIKEHRAKKTLNETPLHFDLARFKDRSESPLFFPGKVLADAASNRLFIADSTHHRVVITDLNGKKLAIAGTGEAGQTDGPFGKASFNDPQGMALQGEVLYVADRKNHLIRALDLKAQTVKTIAGTGVQGVSRRRGGPARKVGLNSPWDLWLHKGSLFIALAGHHQIWRLDLARAELSPYAGAGPENILDGPLDEALFAQPSGLASDGTHLFVADSEVSAIRSVPLNGKGNVETIVGEGLFEFGDVDGVGKQVRIQHALGVAFHAGKLYVADTYNSKIKVIDPAKRSCTTFVGEKPGWLTAPALNEPGGLSHANDKLYVADTNAHRIRVVDLKTRAISTLALQGVEPPKPAAAPSKPFFPNPTRVRLKPATVPGEGDLTLRVDLRLPKGFKLNPTAKMTYLAEAVAEGKTVWSETKSLAEPKPAFDVTLSANQLAGTRMLRFSLVYFECGEASEAICRIKSRIWEVPLQFDPAAKDRVIPLPASPTTK